jgi:FAD/FMN-containing dehydrogenase
METFDRSGLLHRGAGIAAALCGWGLVSEARGASDPRLTALQKLVKGPVIVPSSATYNQVRLVDQERFDDVFPLAIVQPVSASDVSQILTWSRRAKVPLAIRAGGHSYAGYSTTAGVVVDLARLSSITLARSSGIASIGAGARLVDIDSTLAPHGLAIPSGSCPTVGIGGLALGGGVGFAARAFGTTSDNIVSLGIVTADGRFRICSASENPDLYWACRGGGGGNFGVVTHFDLQAHPVADVSVFTASWPWSQAAEVVDAWQSLAPSAPDEFFAVCYLRSGGTAPSIECFGQYLGARAKLTALLSPLAAVAGAALTTRSTSYLDAQLSWAGCAGKTIGECHLVGETPTATLPRANFYAKSDYVNAPLSHEALTTITHWIEQAQAAGFGFGSLELDSYGGVINRVAADATAFVHRNALFSGQYLAHASRPETTAAAARWLRGFYAAMRPFVSGYAYQNYIDPGLATWKHAYYGSNLPRLREIKAVSDPDWLFRFAQGIPPD